jgi:hypothetical protein
MSREGVSTIQLLDHPNLRSSLTTRAVPLEAMIGLVSLAQRPQVGQLLVAEVLKVGKNSTLEDRDGLRVPLFAGDRIIGAFGNRYATHQFEGYVPNRPSARCDLLSVGGVCGKLASQHTGVRSPTRLRVLGLVSDRGGRPLNQRAFAMPPLGDRPTGDVILCVGASMNSGKTTVGGMLTRSLSQAGLRVGAVKLTGTAAGKDTRFYASCGARPAFDFIDAGYPSTYMLDPEDLLRLQRVLLSQLWATGPDYIVMEVADGIFQRETRMLLQSEAFRSSIGHVFFAATDSLSAESGARHLREYGLPLRAVSGLLTQSPLAVREAEEATGVPCLSAQQLREGAALGLVGATGLLRSRGEPQPVKTASRNGMLPKEQVVRLVT